MYDCRHGSGPTLHPPLPPLRPLVAAAEPWQTAEAVPEVPFSVLEPGEDEGQVILAHRIQLDPTAKQREYFARAAGCSRFVYNWAFAEWNAQHEMGGKPKANELARYFNSIYKEQFPWMKEIGKAAHSQPFSDIQSAWRRHFDGLKKGGGSRYRRPKFKKKGQSPDSFYVANDRLSFAEFTVRIPVIGLVRMTENLRLHGKVMSATVNRTADRWFISVRVEMDDVLLDAPMGAPVGVDLGLTTFATLSTGEKITAPKPLKWAQRKLRRLDRWHKRKQHGSANRRKAVMKLARLHRKVANVRQDFLHKLTTRLAKGHSEICIEDLNVSGMSKNHALAGAIRDAGWGAFRRMLAYKTALYGSRLTVRDRWFASSKLCSVCGDKTDWMPLSLREWACRGCGTVHDRDENAAVNILNGTTAGFAGSNARGDGSAGTQTDGCETAVVEPRTKPGYDYALTT